MPQHVWSLYIRPWSVSTTSRWTALDNLEELNDLANLQYTFAVTVHRCLRNQSPTYVLHWLRPSLRRCSLLHFCWSYRPTVWNSLHCAILLLAQANSDGIWNEINPPVCLFLAFRWQCVRGVLRRPSRAIQNYKCTITYLLTYLPTYLGSEHFFQIAYLQ